jgi:multisubunit Na+/H+ antiporter MnhB subunit
MSTIILRTAAKLLVPLSLVFAVFIYFKGHQTPGGGFVAGLVASVALIVHRMSEGGSSLRRMLPMPERTFIAVGLLLALGTGFGAMLFDLPFFTSAHGYIYLPQTTSEAYSFEWASVMAFDLGVFMVVAGVVAGMIDALTRELE